MKKIYTTLFLIGIAILSNAAERTWIISNGFSIPVNNSSLTSGSPTIYTTTSQNGNWPSTLCTSNCSEGLEIALNYKTVTKNSIYAPSSSPLKGYVFGGALQIDGQASQTTPPTIPSLDYFSVNVSGNATISIYCIPKDANSKTLNIANSAGTVIGTFTTSSNNSTSNTEYLSATYTGGATKLTIYPTYTRDYNVSCLFIYAITVIDNPTTEDYSAQAETKLKKLGLELQNENAEEVVIYNLSGIKVLSSYQTSINISALPQGLYVAKTANGCMKFIR